VLIGHPGIIPAQLIGWAADHLLAHKCLDGHIGAMEVGGGSRSDSVPAAWT
jgi:hypothetical protein